MWRLAAIAGACLSACSIPSPAPAQTEADARQLVQTVAEGLRAYEQSLPPITLCGLYRGFYTDLYFRLWNDVFAATGEARRMDGDTEGRRAAVAVALWESPGRDRWEREYQGLYRGPNNWVWASTKAPAAFVADMHRVDMRVGPWVRTLDSCSGYPLLSVKAAGDEPAWSPVGLYLGLSEGFGPLGSDLGGRLGTDWHHAVLGRTPDTVTLGMANWSAPPALEEITVEVSTAAGPAPLLRYRWVRVAAGGPSKAVETRWSGFQPVAPGVVVPTKATRWRLDYRYPEAGVLSETQTFTCLSVAATERGTTSPPFWPLAMLLPETPDPGALHGLDARWGNDIHLALGDFSHAEPPAPPEDLLKLDPKAAAQQIKQRYAAR